MKLRWTPRARHDLDAIHDWIVARNPAAATAVIARIRYGAQLLADYPGTGRPTSVAGLLVLPIVRYPYLVYHMIEDDTVVIAHVRHSSRAAPADDVF